MNTVRRTAVRNHSSALTIMNHLCCLFIPRSAPSSPDVSPQSSPRPPRANNDRLTLLTRLVRKGEKKGLFVEKMPVSIYQVKQNLPLHELNTSYSSQRENCFKHSWLSHRFVCVFVQIVRDENLKFMRNRDVYNSDYFNFTLSLASVNAVGFSVGLSNYT